MPRVGSEPVKGESEHPGRLAVTVETDTAPASVSGSSGRRS